MKKSRSIALMISFLLHAAASFAQKSEVFDVQKLSVQNGLEVYNRQLTPVNEETYKGIRLSKDLGEGVAWIKGMEFSEGIIEFDVRGENVKQHSFVGLAFHGVNDSTFDAVYFRPFHFKEESDVLKKRRVQYISLPIHTWRALREQFPGKYENDVTPAPDPDSWFKVRIVIKRTTVSVFVNGKKEACLIAEKLTSVKNGKIGFYVADTSGGDFANFVITKTE
jgi:hypothetical protein